MLDHFLQDQAALYASGHMPAEEREQFEVLLEFHTELRALVTDLSEAAAAVTLSTQPAAGAQLSAGLKARILGATAGRKQQTSSALVVSSPEGLVQWVSPAFTEMCGYSLEELQGRRLGPILQGEKTDPAAAERLRSAVKEARPCCETLLNYHKNGTPYWVEVAISPYLDDQGQARWLMARETELAGQSAA
ncbi:MAG: PAS domain-containing protein [Chthoniobacteraceae bacterium]